MKQTAKPLGTAFAAIMLSACSGSAASFDGQSAEEIALYILGGVQRGYTLDMPDGGKIRTDIDEDKSAQLILSNIIVEYAGGNEGMVRISVQHKGGCQFAFSQQDLTPRNMFATVKIDADLTGLSGAKIPPMQETMQFEGGKFACTYVKDGSCKYVQKDIDKGVWMRSGWIDRKGKRANEEKKLNEAIAYLKDEVCAPKP